MAAILKLRPGLEPSLSTLLHLLEVNLFEAKPLVSIFQAQARGVLEIEDKQLKLFAF